MDTNSRDEERGAQVASAVWRILSLSFSTSGESANKVRAIQLNRTIPDEPVAVFVVLVDDLPDQQSFNRASLPVPTPVVRKLPGSSGFGSSPSASLKSIRHSRRPPPRCGNSFHRPGRGARIFQYRGDKIFLISLLSSLNSLVISVLKDRSAVGWTGQQEGGVGGEATTPSSFYSPAVSRKEVKSEREFPREPGKSGRRRGESGRPGSRLPSFQPDGIRAKVD